MNTVAFAVLVVEIERLCRDERALGLCRATLQEASAQLEFGHAFVLCFNFKNRYESSTKKSWSKVAVLAWKQPGLVLAFRHVESAW